MTIEATPPQWAEDVLRIALGAREFDNVSGDLLEEYRECIRPLRGARRADQWYVRQVLGFVWRRARWWAMLFAGAFVARTALDWFVPTADFHTRSTLSTFSGAGILLMASVCAAWRSGSIAVGPLIGVATAAAAAPMAIAGAAILLALRHDPMTLAAIQGSGGLAEVFTLPLTMVVPAIVLGVAGGLLGAAAHRRG